MVEQLLMRGTYRRRIVDFTSHGRSYLIDVDLVRGMHLIFLLLSHQQPVDIYCCIIWGIGRFALVCAKKHLFISA